LQFVESASLETEVNTKEPNNNQLVLLVAGLTIPVLASAKLFSFLMAKPLATALSIFLWYLVIYWISPRPRMNAWLWFAIVSGWSVVVYLLVFFQLLPF
jgi:hypothetical protein